VALLAYAAPSLEHLFAPILPAGWTFYPRCVFLVGIVPALLVFWLRRNVPETAEWKAAQNSLGAATSKSPTRPGVRDLLAPASRRISVLAVLVCACSLTGWWA